MWYVIPKPYLKKVIYTPTKTKLNYKGTFFYSISISFHINVKIIQAYLKFSIIRH